jgi:hypothetical protein
VVTAIRDTFCRMDGKARVNGTVVAEASMMCKMVDLSEFEQPPPEPVGSPSRVAG